MQISTRRHFQLCNLGWHLLYKHRLILACFPQHFGTQVFHGLRSRLRQDLLSTNFTQHRSKTRISKTLYYFLGCHCIPSSVLGDDNPAPAADARLGECGTHSSPSEPGRRCPHHISFIPWDLSSCGVPDWKHDEWMASHFSPSWNTHTTWIPFSFPKCSAFSQEFRNKICSI